MGHEITCTAEPEKRTVLSELLAEKFAQGGFVFFFFLALLIFGAAHRRRRAQHITRDGLHRRGGAKRLQLFLLGHMLI